MAGDKTEDIWQLHATTIAIDGQAIILRGPSGSGKSDLALRLMDRGAMLVADDRTDLTLDRNRLVASAPAAIRGKMELRGLGILSVDVMEGAPVAVIIDLVGRDDVDRLPERHDETFAALTVPRFALHAFDASAAIKAELILQLIRTGQIDREYPAAILAPK